MQNTFWKTLACVSLCCTQSWITCITAYTCLKWTSHVYNKREKNAFGKKEHTADKKMGVITKTCLYKFDPLQPHFYIVKLGFTGVYIIFLILLNNIDCGYSLEPPRWRGSNEYPQSIFWAEIWKMSGFVSEIFFRDFGGEIFYMFE